MQNHNASYDDTVNVAIGTKYAINNATKGNPGYGGTEFLFNVLEPYINSYGSEHTHADTYYARDHDVSEQANEIKFFVDQATKYNKDVLVWNGVRNSVDESTINACKDAIEDVDCSVIVWCHNMPRDHVLDFYVNSESIKHVVGVSNPHANKIQGSVERQYSDIVNPCEFVQAIHNMVQTEHFENQSTWNSPVEITFLGNFSTKFPEYVTQAWGEVTEKAETPVHLNIIGGETYGIMETGGEEFPDQNINKMDISNQSKENVIRHVTTDTGDIRDDVVFHGNIDAETKHWILAESDIGIVNPTGLSETFSLSAVELQAAGTPVVAGDRGGLRETVKHDVTGIRLEHATSQNNDLLVEELIDTLVELVNNDVYRSQLQGNTQRHACKFHPEVIIPKWEQLLHCTNS